MDQEHTQDPNKLIELLYAIVVALGFWFKRQHDIREIKKDWERAFRKNNGYPPNPDLE